ncbi:MAG: hypothetical protein ACRC5A_13785 [Enterobacteriaceae bacterium]
MKLIIYIISVILTGGLTVAYSADNKVFYRSLFDIQDAYCSIKTNGVVGQDNTDSAAEGRGYGTGSTAAMLLMQNGENKISVEIASVSWFKKESTNKSAFSPDAYCNLKLMKYSKQGSQEISTINIKINNDGQPVIVPADPSVIEQQRIADKIQPGFIPEHFYYPELYPEGMKLYEFTRIINVNGLPQWEWIKATPYTDTAEQRKLLQQAYQEVWTALQHKDINKLRNLFSVSSHAFAYAVESTPEEIFQDNPFFEKID